MPSLRQGVREQVVGAAVEAGAGDDLVAGAGEVEDGQEVSAAWPDAVASAADAAFERGDALLEDVVRRVHDAGVDVAELLQPEEIGGVVGVLEDVGRGLVDRHGARACRGIGPSCPACSASVSKA